MGAQARRVGLIARCDQGGLGNQTWDLFRHLRPASVMLVRLGSRGRGREFPERYGGDVILWHNDGDVIPEAKMHEFLMGIDVLLTVETAYCARAFELARERGVRTVIVANPELYVERGADEVVCPTPWELHRMPTRARVIPHPVALDRLPFRERTECRTFFHPAAPAMLDRNGTRTVLAALEHVKEECTVVVHSAERIRGWESDVHQVGKVTLVVKVGLADDYWDAYPDAADVMVLPRKYGGLCLPAQESAALGMPLLTSDLSPQNTWPHAVGVSPRVVTSHNMKGGRFDVHEFNPRELASLMTAMVRTPHAVQELSVRARTWAEERSWGSLIDQWRAVL